METKIKNASTEPKSLYMVKDLPICAQTIKWLISKGFDVFNWIDNGLAVDSTQLS